MKRKLLILAGLSLLLAPPDALAQREVTGRVTAQATGEPLAGAEVYIEGTRLGTLADEGGNFRIQVSEGDVELRANFLGFKSESVTVPADATTTEIALEEDVLQLEGVVVTGIAATIARRNAANAVAVVSGADIERVPTQSVESALQGKVLGALIQENSGAPGGGLQVSFRGVSSINADADPLYVVDGVIISNAAISSGANAITGAEAGGSSSNQDNPVNRIADLDPRDIERIEVLKGASAGAIYGSKAANGVVIITTKKGRGGEAKPQFNVTGRLGSYGVAETIGSRAFETAEEAIEAFADQEDPADVARVRALHTGRTFDYEEELYGQHDVSYEGTANVSGGGGETRYYAAGLLKNDQGIMEGTGYEKQSLRLNLDQRVGSSMGLSLSTNLIHSRTNRALSNNDNTGTSFYMVLPFTPSFVDLFPENCPEPGAATCRYPDNPFERSNPIQTRDLLKNEQDVFRFLGSVRSTYDLIASERHNLQLIGDVGVDFFNQTDELLAPPELEFEPQDGLPGTSILSNGDNTNLNTSLNAAYTFSPGAGTWSSTTTAGVQYTESDQEVNRTFTRNLIAGQGNVDQGASVDVDEDRLRTEDFGIYAQEELLLLDERLLLTGSVRADQSSANGDDEKLYVFPKAAASYRFEEVAPWLESFKLRGAFGQTGNRPLFGQKFTPLFAANIDGLTGIGVGLDDPGVAGDPEIQPERQTEYELGFDATLFDERASLEFSVYQKTIEDLILQRTLAPSTGFATEFFNGGQLENRGLEAGLSLTPVLTDDVNWVFRTTFFTNESEISDLPVPAFETGGFGTALGAFSIEEGQSATQIVGNDGACPDVITPASRAPCQDPDGSGPLEAEVAPGGTIVSKLGDAYPDFTMSFINDINFGGFNLYSLWDWKKGSEIINLTKLLYDFGQNTADFEPSGAECPAVISTAAPGEEGYPTVDSPGCQRIAGFGTFAGPYVEEASFFKLRELSLSYDVAPALQGGFFGQDVRYVRVGVSGRNLVTFSPYEGLTPEVSNFGNQTIARNIDVAPFPPSRSFWLTIDVGF